MSKQDLYYECHITVDPLYDQPEKLKLFQQLCDQHGFWIADLFMVKTDMNKLAHTEDCFCTGRAKTEVNGLISRAQRIIKHLQANDIRVRRYKIETATVDSKIEDSWNMLNK